MQLLIRATRVARLYGADHNNVVAMLPGVVDAWQQMTATGPVRVTLTDTAINAHGRLIALANGRDAFPTGLYEDGIKALVLHPGVTVDAAHAMLEEMTQRDRVVEPGACFADVACVEAQLEGEDEGGEPDALQSVLADACPQKDAVTDDAGGWACAASTPIPPLGDLESLRLSEAERAALQAEVALCTHETGIRHVSRVIAHLWEAGEGRSPLPESLDSLMEYMVREGSLRLGVEVIGNVAQILQDEAIRSRTLPANRLHRFFREVEADPDLNLMEFAGFVECAAEFDVAAVVDWLLVSREPDLVASVLYHRGDAARDVLLAALHGADTGEREVIVALLRRFVGAETIVLIDEFFPELAPAQRRQLVRAAIGSQDPEVRRMFVRGLLDDDPEVRSIAIQGVGNEDEPVLASVLEDLLAQGHATAWSEAETEVFCSRLGSLVRASTAQVLVRHIASHAPAGELSALERAALASLDQLAKSCGRARPRATPEAIAIVASLALSTPPRPSSREA